MPPPLKRCRLEVPHRVARQKAKEERCALLQQDLMDIEKVIASKKTQFVSRYKGLQAYCARAIHSYLFIIVKNGRNGIEASERAAESKALLAKDLSDSGVRRWSHEAYQNH